MTKILAVEDSVTMQQCLAISFAGTEFELLSCGDADEAMRKLGTSKPALVIADVSLAPRDGYELCANIKSASPGVPVVLLSSQHQPFDAARGVDADAHLDKPFDTQKLQDLVRSLVAARAVVNETTPDPLSSSTPPPLSRSALPPVALDEPGADMLPSSHHSSRSGGADSVPPPMVPSGPRQAGARVPAGVTGAEAAAIRTQQTLRGLPNPNAAGVGLESSDPPSSVRWSEPAGGSGSEIPERPSSLPSPPTPPPLRSESYPYASPISVEDAAAEVSEEDDPPSWPLPSDEPTASSEPQALARAQVVDVRGLRTKLGQMGLTPTQIEGVLALSHDVIEKVVWEVVPVLAETMIKEELARLTRD